MTRMPWEVTPEMFLSEKEVGKLLNTVRRNVRDARGRAIATARMDQLIVEGLLFSGLRSSEFCQLTIADTIAGHDESTFVVRGKGSQQRTVHIPQSLSRLVKSFIKEVRPAFLPENVKPGDAGEVLLFNEHRQPFQRTGLYRRVVRILTAAGLGNRASVQLLRHTYGYLAYLRTGGNLLFVQQQLGHAHPMVTLVYARFVPESYENMAELTCGTRQLKTISAAHTATTE